MVFIAEYVIYFVLIIHMIKANDIMKISHFDPQYVEHLCEAVIREPLPIKLNKLKKTNVESFFYWNEIGKNYRMTLIISKYSRKLFSLFCFFPFILYITSCFQREPKSEFHYF